MILKVGITGGIGSGKSTVAKIFGLLGIPVLYADDAAKKLMNEDEHLKAKIIGAFGTDSYRNGTLNRPFIAEKVFNNPAQLTLLNSIVHPATIADADKWMQQQTAPYAIKEAALIFESGAEKWLDKVIGVFAPAPLRIQRVMQRDGITEQEVTARLNKQMNEDDKMRLCDYIINNDEQELLIPQVLKLDAILREEAGSKSKRLKAEG
ncbi:MAG: dephospho-CoA kinase [Ferruginibacter sp.]|uniref:dephospho-CoA kinase n=1 Tax=Ferruginibacter sp. TaxID=1940288 RepID=UPI0026592BA9|nr:dephospho-CoA kinase [Ferruginibacter sp.]MDB5280322.1 dephospho-CoA kinase [Ferruginibacter sp.]